MNIVDVKKGPSMEEFVKAFATRHTINETKVKFITEDDRTVKLAIDSLDHEDTTGTHINFYGHTIEGMSIHGFFKIDQSYGEIRFSDRFKIVQGYGELRFVDI